MLNLYKVMVSLVLSLFLSSCVSVGEVAPEKVVDLSGTGKSRITGEVEFKGDPIIGDSKKIGITSLDGKSLWRMGAFNEYPESLLIEPGQHKVGVRYMQFKAFADGVLWFKAEPEKSYIVKKKTNNYSVSFWLEEVGTGKIVGSIFGEEENKKAN